MSKTVQSYCSGMDHFSAELFGARLAGLVSSYFQKKGRCPILFLCIGSDRVSGDCLGPLVGYKLEKLTHSLPDDFTVIGSLKHPVHAVNLQQQLNRIRHMPKRYLTIAIDASVGCRENLGTLCLTSGALYPGEGVSKSLPAVGQISITAVTSCEENPLPFHRQNVPLSFIMELADHICRGILTFSEIYTELLPALLSDPDFPGRRLPGLRASAYTADPFQKQIRTSP